MAGGEPVGALVVPVAPIGLDDLLHELALVGPHLVERGGAVRVESRLHVVRQALQVELDLAALDAAAPLGHAGGERAEEGDVADVGVGRLRRLADDLNRRVERRAELFNLALCALADVVLLKLETSSAKCIRFEHLGTILLTQRKLVRAEPIRVVSVSGIVHA